MLVNLQYNKEIQNLPIYSHLDDICETLKSSVSRFMVLTAETGAGKSTALPVALVKHFSNRIFMLEPRRLAVVGIAERVASLLGEKCGETSGYVMHLEKNVSRSTRFTVMTEAVLTRMLQNDPLLEGVDVVVIDEFHERSVHVDLALAFLKEVMALRDDLYVVVMSATIDSERISEYLGGCPVYSVEGKTFPVEVEYRADENVSRIVLQEFRRETFKKGNSMLVFLPGLKEIRRECEAFTELLESEGSCETSECETLILHSSVSFDEQKKILKGNSETKRVIFTSAIAETSLTVPGVNVVIDSGFCRIKSYNQKARMDMLTTQIESEFNAKQRTGRAGRTMEGRCVRLWNVNNLRVKETKCELLRCDLMNVVLECAEWGACDFGKIQWLDSPSEVSWNVSRKMLEEMKCIRNGSITDFGRACLETGIDLRLASVALCGVPYNKIEFSVKTAMDFMPFQNENLRKKQEFYLIDRVKHLGEKYNVSQYISKCFTHLTAGNALLAGFPDRFAKLYDNDKKLYQFPGGRLAVMHRSISEKCGNVLPEYLVATEVDAGDRTGLILRAEFLDETDAEKFLEDKCETVRETFFEDDSCTKIRKVEKSVFGKIIIRTKNLPVERGDYLSALCEKVRDAGLGILPLGKNCETFLLRVEYYVQNSVKHVESIDNTCENRETLDWKFNKLCETCETWLSPFVVAGEKVSEKCVYDALYYYLDGSSVDKAVPVELVLENGKKRKVFYEKINGTVMASMELIIQQIFGCFTTPEIMGKKVLLKLLSPARRPLQITSDLENFWTNTWSEICSEMKGRYPKHNWDYRVSED